MNNAAINEAGVYEQRPVQREKESVDDFEHLGVDNSPSPTQGDVDLATSVSSAARDLLGEIDKTAENVVDEVHKQPSDLFDNLLNAKMDSNLFEMGDTMLDKDADADDKMDKFISQLTAYAPAVPSHDVSPIIEDRKQFEGIKNFLEMEREKVFINNETAEPLKHGKNLNLSEPHIDDLFDLHPKQPEIPTPMHFEKKESPILDDLISEMVAPPALKIEPVFAEKPVHKISETIVQHPFEPPQAPKSAPPVIAAAEHRTEQPHYRTSQTKIEPTPVKPLKSNLHLEPALTDAEAMFKKMGLDAWFHPERLNPRVESLIYWRDPAKSGPVFGGVLVVLLALTYLSLISVIAYVSLLVLTATISFRIYKNVLQAVQKTGDGHPFKEFLDMDITLPQDKVKEVVETAIAHVNAAGIELRRLFLVDDLVDSIKFGVLLWCFTYLGAWFNGMTLVIIAWVALFTLPKVYETNKTQIDANLDLVRSKIAEITSKVKAAIPIGKKEEKKEQ